MNTPILHTMIPAARFTTSRNKYARLLIGCGLMLLLTCGAHKNVIRFLMPLVATTEDIDQGLRLLERSLLEAAA